MPRLLIVGAGGHAQVVADIVLSSPTATLVGFVDDDPQRHHQELMTRPILGSLAYIPQIAHDALLIGIGHNATRRALFERMTALGLSFATAIHPTAVIGRHVTIGAGTVICAGVIINTGSAIGRNAILNTAATIDHHNQIGDHVHLAPGAHLGGDVTIGAGALVGIGATVMPQRTVGAESIVGAGALVQRDVAPSQTVIGVPARPLERKKDE